MGVIGQYKIDYLNGIMQTKNLISHSDYESVIKSKMKLVRDAEIQKNDQEAAKLNSEIKNEFGEYWFTDKSPLFDAIEIGEIDLLPHQGGRHKCKIVLINPVHLQ